MMAMNENNGEKATSLAITEKQTGHHRNSRPGGCVGIFFQLFDWNRRIAKKKLFPKKLLPLPVRAKQAFKRFGASDKLPAATKLHLIADENRGGFPSARHCGIDDVGAEQKHEMRPAGLVAKLMGLESLPKVHRIKPLKTLGSETPNSKDIAGDPSEHGNEEINLDKAQMKLEISRPQKVQKTGQLDGQTLAKFGAEALQFRNVISRSSRKQHQHPKLASPPKGPKVFSARKNTSRLIDVATKILEPGLHAKSRPKYILTNSNSMPRSLEGISGVSHEVPNQLDGYANTNVNSSCRSCGNPLDNLASRSSMEKYPAGEASAVSNQVNVTSQGFSRSMSNPPLSSSLQQDRDKFLEHALDQTADYGAQELIYRQACFETQKVDLYYSTKDDDEKWPKSTGLPRPHRASFVAAVHKPPIQATNHISQGKESILPRSKCSYLESRRDTEAISRVNGGKDFVALNRSLSGRTRLRMQNNVGSAMPVTDRKCYNEKSDSLQQMKTPPRKRRTTTSYGSVQGMNSVDTSVGKHGDHRPGIFSGKRIELNDRPLKQTCDRSRSTTTQGSGNNVISNKNMDVISFSLNSPLKHRTEMLSAENEGKISSQKPFLIGGDALDVLLEQRPHELTCQGEDESAAGDTLPNKTTAMILQELISALTSNYPIYEHNENVGRSQNGDFKNAVQLKKKSAQSSVHSHSADPFSPGSVLEASFSNSSSSSCLDDCLGHKTFLDSVDYACDSRQALEPNVEIWSSAASMDKRTTETGIMLRLVNYTSNLINNIDQFGSRLSGSKLVHVKEVLLNAELFCRTGMAHSSDEIEESIVDHLLLYELEDLSSVMRKKSMCLSGLEESDKQGKQLKVFLFDSVIEYLDLCGSFYNFGLKGWGRLPSFLDAKFLIESIDKEIRKWADLAGKLPDEVIEWEMSHSLGKWTDFEIEALETGIEIESDLFRSLVDEIVSDIYESCVGSI